MNCLLVMTENTEDKDRLQYSFIGSITFVLYLQNFNRYGKLMATYLISPVYDVTAMLIMIKILSNKLYDKKIPVRENGMQLSAKIPD